MARSHCCTRRPTRETRGWGVGVYYTPSPLPLSDQMLHSPHVTNDSSSQLLAQSHILLSLHHHLVSAPKPRPWRCPAERIIVFVPFIRSSFVVCWFFRSLWFRVCVFNLRWTRFLFGFFCTICCQRFWKICQWCLALYFYNTKMSPDSILMHWVSWIG